MYYMLMDVVFSYEKRQEMVSAVYGLRTIYCVCIHIQHALNRGINTRVCALRACVCVFYFFVRPISE